MFLENGLLSLDTKPPRHSNFKNHCFSGTEGVTWIVFQLITSPKVNVTSVFLTRKWSYDYRDGICLKSRGDLHVVLKTQYAIQNLRRYHYYYSTHISTFS